MRLAGSASLLRAINERAVLGHLLEQESLTRGEIVELTGLSKPTASQALGRLESAGLVEPVGETSGSPGRNAAIYAVVPDIVLTAAVDVRPGALTIAVGDVHGKVRAEIQHPMTARAGAAATVVEALHRACAEGGLGPDQLDLVQLAVPGSYDPTADTFRYVTHVPGWSSPGVVGKLRGELGATKVLVDNDVNLAAAAERTRGVAGGSDGFVLLWVSTGLGLAIDLGGELLRGARGGAGEVGYMPAGPVVQAGSAQGTSATRGEFQDLVGAPAVRMLGHAYGLSGRSADTIVRRAVDSDNQPFLGELAERLAGGLASVLAVLDPPLVVLAGDVCRAGGQTLCDLVGDALLRTTRFDTPVATTGVTGNPVLLGALDAAVTHARADLIGHPTGNTAGSTVRGAASDPAGNPQVRHDAEGRH